VKYYCLFILIFSCFSISGISREGGIYIDTLLNQTEEEVSLYKKEKFSMTSLQLLEPTFKFPLKIPLSTDTEELIIKVGSALFHLNVQVHEQESQQIMLYLQHSTLYQEGQEISRVYTSPYQRTKGALTLYQGLLVSRRRALKAVFTLHQPIEYP